MINSKIIFVVIASSVLFGCASPGVDGYSQSKSPSSSAAAGLSGGFRPNETLHVYSSSHPGQRKGVIQETGDSYNYAPVARDVEIVPIAKSSDTDTSSLLAAKRVKVLGGCNKDKVSDKTTCRMNILPQGTDQKGGLYQTLDTNGSLLSSCVIGHDFPGKMASIKVDDNTAIKTNDKGCIGGSEAQLLEQQLLAGKRLITRRVEWPYEALRDKEFIIAGSFSSALELYRWSATADLKQLFSAR